ncbi:MAG: hypothetical protein FP820_04880 [Sulfurimonas sp.]|nr:hypothetical protein [Sulfurimonas sp.]MBU3940002.1 hypothetical protein [bacterium]MBU4023991.1 hypothetical protein [bacterium]MBU4058587.1 hypothetical protein [bacterium]
MTTHLIGQLMEVKPTEYTDKKTDKVSYNTELTVMFEGLDEEGYRKISVETVSTDEDYYEELKDRIGQTVALPYLIKVTQYGVQAYPDKSMPVLTLEKNPLDYTKFKRLPKSEVVKKP